MNKELHWKTNDMLNKAIFSLQEEIESYKSELKRLRKSVSAIHLEAIVSIKESLYIAREDMDIYMYLQGLLDEKETEKSTLDTVRGYLSKQRPTRDT